MDKLELSGYLLHLTDSQGNVIPVEPNESLPALAEGSRISAMFEYYLVDRE